MVRTPNRCDKSGLNKGAWTPEEDNKLIAYVTRYGHWNWCQLPKFAGLARCGKSCRLRWLNYLRPNIKRGNYTQEEDQTIIKLLQHLGNKWSAINAQLPGRTDNDIKNHWHTKLKRQLQQNSSVTNEKALVSKSKDHSPVEPMPDNIIDPFQGLPATSQSTDSCPFSSRSSSSEFSSITPYHTTAASNENLVPDDEFAFLDAEKEPMSGSFWLEPFMADISYFTSEILAPSSLAAEPGYLSPVSDVELWSHDNEYCP